MNQEIQIEKNIPIPLQNGDKISALSAIMRKMEIGDSILWSGSRNSVHGCAQYLSFKMATRKQPDGSYRIWRKA